MEYSDNLSVTPTSCHDIYVEVRLMKQTERYFSPAVFTYAKEQEIAVTFPDLDVATSGENEADALLTARGARGSRAPRLGCVLGGLEEDGEKIPNPTPLSDIRLEENERAVLVDVYMPSVRMARINRSVNRTVTLPAWLNAAASERNVNFSQVLQDALKTQLHLNCPKKA